jgi:epoxyqueuosine reductase QueG
MRITLDSRFTSLRTEHPVASERSLNSIHVQSNLPSRIKQLAREAGFDLCGIAPVREFREVESFPAWIAAEHHGEMRYMEARDDAGELKRGSLARVAPWARSVIVCALNYNTAHPYSTQSADSTRGWISRCAKSKTEFEVIEPAKNNKLKRVFALTSTLGHSSSASTQNMQASDGSRRTPASLARNWAPGFSWE